MSSYEAYWRVIVRADNGNVFVGGPDKALNVFDKNLKPIVQIPIQGNAYSTLMLRDLLVIGVDNHIEVISLDTLTKVWSVQVEEKVYALNMYGEDHIICGQENGHISLVHLETRQKVNTFRLKCRATIYDMIKTNRANNEHAFATESGLFFISILNNVKEFQIIESQENYFLNKDVSGIVTLKKDLFAVCLYGEEIRILERATKKFSQTIHTPSHNKIYNSL